MKNLIIIVNAPSNALHQRREFIKHFQSRMKLTIVCPNANSLKNQNGFEHIKLIDLPFSRSGTSILQEVKVLKRLRQVLKSEVRGDTIVHCFTLKPILYTNLLNKLFFKNSLRCFSTFTGLGFLFSKKTTKSFLQKLVTKLLKFCLFKNSQKVIFQNEDDQKNFIGEKIITNDSNVILGSGVDTVYFSYSPKKASKPLVFLYIGRLLKDKGVVELINAFKTIKNPNIHLKIAGDYDFENPQSISEETFETIKSHSKIDHIGFIEDIRQAIKTADVVALPSYREGLPLSLIQACSMGKPILTTIAPGCRQIVDHGVNGLKVQPESVSELSNALKNFIEMSPEALRAMGLASRKKAEDLFSSKTINAQIEALYLANSN